MHHYEAIVPLKLREKGLLKILVTECHFEPILHCKLIILTSMTNADT